MRLGVGMGLGRGGGPSAIPPPVIVSVGTLVHQTLGGIDPGQGSVTVAVASGVAWSLTVNGEAAASGVGTGISQVATFTVTAAMVGTSVTVALAANSTVTTTADVTATWSMADLAPTVWLLPPTGITFTDATVSPVITTWTPTGASTALVSGTTYSVTATSGGTTHAIAGGASGSGSVPTDYRMRVSAAAGGTRWVYLSHGTAAAWFDLQTATVGTTSGAGYDSASITALGGGAFDLVLKSLTFSGNLTLGLADADGSTSFSAAGTETLNVEARPGFGLTGASIVIQRFITRWDDARANGAYFLAAAASSAPAYWVDSIGPCAYFDGTRHLYADHMGASLTGNNLPNWRAGACDHMSTAAVRRMFTLASATAARYDFTAIPLDATHIGGCFRQNDAGTAKAVPTITATPVEAAAFVDDFAGAQRYLVVGTQSANADASVADYLTVGRVTLGALRYNVGSIETGARLIGRLREFALGVNDTLTPTERSTLVANRTTRYGY